MNIALFIINLPVGKDIRILNTQTPKTLNQEKQSLCKVTSFNSKQAKRDSIRVLQISLAMLSRKYKSLNQYHFVEVGNLPDICACIHIYVHTYMYTVADPGFPVGGRGPITGGMDL